VAGFLPFSLCFFVWQAIAVSGNWKDFMFYNALAPSPNEEEEVGVAVPPSAAHAAWRVARRSS
jgi:hypothetical protein